MCGWHKARENYDIANQSGLNLQHIPKKKKKRDVSTLEVNFIKTFQNNTHQSVVCVPLLSVSLTYFLNNKFIPASPVQT